MCFPAGNALHSCVLRNTGSYRKLAQPVNFLTTACLQGIWWDDSSLLTLPHMDRAALQALAARKLEALPQLLIEARRQPARAQQLLEQVLGSAKRAQECLQVSSLQNYNVQAI